MESERRWRSFTKSVLGFALIAAPLLILIGGLISVGVDDPDDTAAYLASIADHQAANYAGNVIGAAGAVGLVGVVIALVHLVRVRRPTLAKVAGGIALAGAILLPGVWLTFTILETQMADEANRAAMVALLENTEDSGRIAPLLVAWLGTALGMLLLAIGLFLARTVPRWIPVVLGVAFVLSFFGGGDALQIATGVAITAALGYLGVLVLRSSLADWEAGDLSRPTPTAAPEPAAPTPA